MHSSAVFQSDCLLPLKCATCPDSLQQHFTQLDPVLTDEFLTKCRTYLGLTRSIDYSLTEDAQKV